MPSTSTPMTQLELPLPDTNPPMSYTPSLKQADLRGVDARSAVFDRGLFTSASFKHAHFSRANFSGATFNGCTFESALMDGVSISRKHIAIYGLRHLILITPTHMFIGCMHYTHEEWRNMTDEQIIEQDTGAAEVWNVWKTALLAACSTLEQGITR